MFAVSPPSDDATIVDNPPPDYVPPARYVAPLTPISESHWTISLLLGSTNSSYTLPSSSSIAVQFVLDLGIQSTLLFSKSNLGRNLRTPSMDPQPSDVLYQTQGVGYGLSLDYESYQFGPVLGVSDLLTLPLQLMGTNQKEYFIKRVSQIYVSNNTVDAKTASQMLGDVDTNDATTLTLINPEYYDLSDGSLGLCPDPAPTASGTPAQQLLGGPTTFFSLDLGGNEMHVGGVSEEYRAVQSWTSGPVTDGVNLPAQGGPFTFPVHHMKICGVDMFQNLTTTWHALVDSGASCLGLPAEFYDMAISWLPVKCNLGRFTHLPYICYFGSDINKQRLPTLSFRLADQGRELFIDLSQLLFAFSNLDNRLCLTRMSSMLNPPSSFNAIVFGGRVLKQFYTTFDWGSRKVAFANRDPYIKESRANCASRVMCGGMQVHYEPLNLCLPPACDDYYFFEYDASTKSCVLSSSFHIVVSLLIFVFLVTELGLNEMIMHLSKKVMANAIAPVI